ncbi:MAG TPA: hypothetical protein GX713_04695 [Mollicutes bacterium]|nr:hypothetical protein [Mollicutes bacterium]
MKRIVLLLIIICFIILTIFKVDARKTTFPLIGKLIIIDPGHGGVDNGASHLGVNEDEINLLISLELRKALEKEGATVMMTRDGDYDLSRPNAIYRKKSDFDNRIRIINNSDSDLYLSIHLNFFHQSSYYGPQVFYYNDQKLAEVIQNELNNNLNSKRKAKKMDNSNYMYSKLNINGVLIECGFLSNTNERNKLSTKEYQKNLALIITKGVINYYN